VLFVEPLLSYCSHFVICNGTNTRQVRAIANHVVGKLKAEHGVSALSIEGLQIGRWVLIDFGDVVLHVFDQKLRGFYDLDSLWADAERVEVPGYVDQPQRAWL
jgi:ribosome-associated protein